MVPRPSFRDFGRGGDRPDHGGHLGESADHRSARGRFPKGENCACVNRSQMIRPLLGLCELRDRKPVGDLNNLDSRVLGEWYGLGNMGF